jgi:uncharacterized circularly permuted ATP-grasp superfamily protein
VTPLDQLIIQNKKIAAFWHAYRPWFTTAEQALIQRYVPYTRCFEPRQVRSYRQERESIVLKKIEGRQGEEVLVGGLIPPEEWAEVVAAIAAHEPGAWTVQDRVDIRPIPFPHPQTGQREWMFPCLGVYVVQGAVGGFYTRLSRTPKTNYQALNVATLVATAAQASLCG